MRGVVLLGPIVRDLPLSPTTMLALQVGFGGPWRVQFWMAYGNALFPTGKLADHDRIATQLEADLDEPGRVEALLAMLALCKADTAAIVPRSRVPTLIVMGARGPDFDDPAAEAEALSRQLGGETPVVEGAGHYPHVEMPDLVAPGVVSFVDKFGLRPAA